INSRLLSKLWYLGYFVSFPPWFFKALSQITSVFLWDAKRPQIALASIQTSLKLGGLGLIKPELQIMASKAWWLKRMAQDVSPGWMGLALYIFRGRDWPVGASGKRVDLGGRRS